MSAEAEALHTVFRVNVNGKQTAPTKVLKRNRDPVSCAYCRSKKLRCDRLAPCSSCIGRGIGNECTYAPSKTSRNIGRDQARTLEAQRRLERLEGLVTNLMSSNRQEDTPAQSLSSENIGSRSIDGTNLPPGAGTTVSDGHLDVQTTGISYHGSTHWQAILQNIQDIKSYLDSQTLSPESEPSPDSDVDPVVDGHRSITIPDAINALPPRSVVDASLSIYFNAKYLAVPVLHTVKFRREYEGFWADPTSVSLIWLSIVFSIICTASRIAEATGRHISDAPGHRGAQFYYTKASQCLVTGGYKHAKPYSIEALIQYSLCKYLVSSDRDVDGWSIIGYTTRLAMKMGYHRDSKHFTKISCFEGEMRRRVWMIIEAFDLLFSFQLGLPTIIHEDEFDTEPPSNLFDEDFGEDCLVLPQSRPQTDPTPMLYFSYKISSLRVFRRVVQHCMCLKEKSYDETTKLDAELRAIHQETPPSLQIRPLSLSFTDEPHLILSRINLELFFLKGLCVLHRQYLTYDRSNPKYAYSRHVCSDAAFGILKLQDDLNQTTQAGGQLFREKWMLVNLTLQDFLLAAMILCLALHESRSTENIGTAAWREKYEAIKASYQYWDEKKSFSRDAARASAILARMLHTLKPYYDRPESQPHSTFLKLALARNSQGVTPPFEIDVASPDNSVLLDQGPSISFPSFDPDWFDPQPLDAIVGDGETLDWTLIDQYLSERPIGPDGESEDVS